MAREGVLGADETGVTAQVPTFAIRGPIDIVGAGDSVSANLAMALAAASIVIHQVGTTGTATRADIGALMFRAR
jgi:bifunctional ADP-heptose synthase (sugar kinase/adenylyltransferase)